MSDKFNFHRSTDRYDKSQHHRQSKYSTVKQEENDQYRQCYPAFELPTSFYKVVIVNKNTSIDDMHLIINHVQECTQYTIDTESEKSNGKLALIQIQSIPRRLPLLTILIELAQLPSQDSTMYVAIKQFFELIFRSNNELYAWGDLARELNPAINYHLFNWPILSSMIDIQLHFPAWYDWALAHCESCSPDHQPDGTTNRHVTTSKNVCIHHEPSPYRPQEKWSLQKAMVYAAHMFIDKTSTLSNWAAGLTTRNSILSSHRQKIMIHYAIYDCFSTTYFIQAIMNRWTFVKLKNTNLTELFTSFQSTPLPTIPVHKPPKNKKIKNINPQHLFKIMDDELEPVSDDDEIYLSQIISPQPIAASNDKTHSSRPLEQYLETSTMDVELIIQAGDDFLINDNREITSIDHQEQPPEAAEERPPEEAEEQQPAAAEERPPEEAEEQQPAAAKVQPTIAESSSSPEQRKIAELSLSIEQQQSDEHQQKSNHQRRSADSRKRRNRKRNTTRRKYRYNHSFTRSIYYKFTMPLIKKILKQHDLRYVNLKIVDGSLIIGVKQAALKQQYEQQLPETIFDRRHFQSYSTRRRE